MPKYKKVKIFLLFFIIIAVLTSCSIINEKNEENKIYLLENELHKWNKIRLDGIISLNYKQFSLRKNFVLKKNKHSGRLDIVDKGIFGLKPTPFFSAYIDSIAYLRLPEQKEINIIDIIIPKNLFDFSILLKEKYRIIKQYSYETGELQLFFKKNMQFDKLVIPKEHFEIIFFYNQLKILSIMEVYIDNKSIAKLEIDKISNKFNKINKLN